MIEAETREMALENAPGKDDLDAEALLAAVLEAAGLTPEAYEALRETQRSRLELASRELAGVSYAIHAPTRTLYIQDYLTQEVYAEIPLFTDTTVSFGDSEAPRIEVESWEPWGTALCCINAHSGQIESFLREGLDDELYGLVITPGRSFLYARDPYRTAVFAESNQCLYPRVHKPSSGGPTATAYDLYLSEDRAWLCISDREAGSLIVIDTNTRELKGRVRIRPPGSTKALNLAFDYYEPKLFVTDNQSNQLFILNLEDLSLETLSLGQPGMVFGNLVRSPDIRYLYLVVLKPSPGLHYVNIETEDFDDSMNLKGGLFSSQQIDPTDLMLLTPDQNHLLLVTSHNDPSPFTPAISVIDPHQFQPLRFHTIAHALRDQTKPVALVYAFPNPTLRFQQDGLDLLLAEGLITAGTIETARRRLAASLNPAEPQELVVVDLDDPAAPSHGQGPVPALAPQAAEAIVLDRDVAIPAIVFALSQKLYQQCEIELNAHKDELARFQKLAEDYRQALEGHDAVEVQIPQILGKHSLEAYLTRQDILSLIAKGALMAEGVVRPPHACPACAKPLRGNWDCAFCHLELESPQRLAKKKASSLDSLGAVTRFQVLVTDPKRRRLLILDDNKTIDWELSGQDLPGHMPWNALWLPNQNLLVVDREASQVFECSPSGTMAWSLDQTQSPAHSLKHPVKASYFSSGYDDHFLIVDQGNHRVMVVNRRHQILWQYGQQAVPGATPGYLNSPSDLQLTYEGTYLIADTGNDRVIEVRDGEIIRSFGPAQGLRAPVFAQRLFDRDTLIVDAGNYRLLELDAEGELVSECFYFTDEMGEELRIDAPTRVYRREKKSVILMDEDRIVEILPLKHRLIWSSLLKHLARRVEIARDAFDKRDSYVQSFHQYRIPTLNELLDRLRKENRLESSSGIAQRIFDNLAALIDENRARDRARERSAQVRRLSERPLAEIPLYVVDRTNQQVVRVDRDGRSVWHFGLDIEHRLLRPTHVSETPESLLIADTHHDRVIEVSLTSMEPIQIFGAGKQLSKPRSAWRTLAGNTLVSDQGNKRLVEFDPAGNIVWTFQSREISYPYFALELGKGTILYVDWALHVVKEITRAGELIWAYGQSSRSGSEENRLASPEYAVRLNSGAILIADTGNHRILEVSPKRRILWEFSGNKQFSLHKPTFCQRLPNGHTLIAYNAYRSLLEVDREGEAQWHFELGSDPLASRDMAPPKEGFGFRERLELDQPIDMSQTLIIDKPIDMSMDPSTELSKTLVEHVEDLPYDPNQTLVAHDFDLNQTIIEEKPYDLTMTLIDDRTYDQNYNQTDRPTDDQAYDQQAYDQQSYAQNDDQTYDPNKTLIQDRPFEVNPALEGPVDLTATVRIDDFNTPQGEHQTYDQAVGQPDYQYDDQTAYAEADYHQEYQTGYQSETQTEYQTESQAEYQSEFQAENPAAYQADYQADYQPGTYNQAYQEHYQETYQETYQHVDQPEGEIYQADTKGS